MTIFGEITLLVVVAAVIALIMRLLKQPLVIGYIITGLLVGPLFLDLIHSEETLNLFSEIGVAFLLFIVGLNLTPQAVKTFGKVSLMTGLGQVIFTFVVGWLIAKGLGFSSVAAAYLSIGLAFSSTIIILKLLSDKGDLSKLYGKISIGFLLVQDFIAVGILFFLPLFAGQSSGPEILLKLSIALLALVFVYWLAHNVLPKLNRFVARSQELLFLFAIAWGFGFATLFQQLGFSLESGALIAGATLSILPSHDEIHSRLKPLRDFFLVLFFITLGAKIVLAGAGEMIVPAIILSAFVLLMSPVIMMVIMGAMGYRKKTSFQTGLTVAQISEFSLIIVGLGVVLGHVDNEVLSLMTIVGVFTIFVSSYLIMNSERVYSFFAPLIGIFERSRTSEQAVHEEEHEAMLFGHNRIGYDFLEMLKKEGVDVLVVDYDPDVIKIMEEENVAAVYGDASDLEFLRMLNLKKTKLVVSTIPSFSTNRLILKTVREQNRRIVVVAVSHTIEAALKLYEDGADYVIMPHFLGGHAASEMVEGLGFERKAFKKKKKDHISYLKKRRDFGFEHPVIDRL